MTPIPLDLSTLAFSLRSQNPADALQTLAGWVQHTSFRQIRSTLLSTPPALRPTLATAVSDLLSGYPVTRWGIPILLHGTAPNQPNLIPHPPAGTTLITLRQVLSDQGLASDTIYPDRNQVVLLQLGGDAFEPPALPADAFLPLIDAGPGGSIKIAGGKAFVWPEAVEVAIRMQAVLLDPAECAVATVFVGDAGWAYASETAGRFRQAVLGENEI